uniref:Uncharacterized protein n=1 Tax=Chenopodium quinoa TaxID=63459 RepID=A0A803NEV6_CHEQI
MASQQQHLRDEHGNPVELTDEHGHPVKLTDEHGHPIHLTGVACTDEHGNPVDTRGLHSTATHGDVGHDSTMGTRGVIMVAWDMTISWVVSWAPAGLQLMVVVWDMTISWSNKTHGGGVGHDNLMGTHGVGTHGMQSTTTHTGVGHDNLSDTHGWTHGGVGHDSSTATHGTHSSATRDAVLPKNPLTTGMQSSTLGGAAHGTHGGPMTSGMPSATLGGGMHGHDEPGHRAPGTLGDVLGGGQHQPRRDQPGGTAVGIVTKEIRRSGTSSGESSEEEGHTPTGGRRKKKGLGEKIKDKLMPGGKHKDQEARVEGF